jgi:hypothetical protein
MNMGCTGLNNLSRLIRCGSCGAGISCNVYLDKAEFSRDLRDELLSDDILVDCLFCDEGVMALDDDSFSSREEPEIWGFY